VPAVFCTSTYDSDADLPAPGDTPMPMPERVRRAVDGDRRRRIGRDRAPVAASWKPATLPRLGSLLAGRLTRIGPLCVAMVTFVGTMIGSASLRRAAPSARSVRR
jgi:hypothetical protein